MTELLLGCGVVGAVLFVVTFTIDGATRDGYRATYLPVSALALGSRGWMQTSNFVITGVLMIAAAVGTRLALQVIGGPLLLGLFGISLVASGVFPMDPMCGYPPGTPPGRPTVVSRRNRIHDVFGFLVFGSLAAAGIAFALVLPFGGWALYSLVTSAAVVALFIIFGSAMDNDKPNAGTIQRLAIITGWTWVALFCLSLI